MIGKKLAHYEITGLLGKGGMGEVYRAHDGKLDREVALKLLPAELSRDVERVARFEREATTLAKLQHANIATIYGFEQDGEHRFLIMELVEGEDLAARLAHGPIPPDDAIDIALQICEGLEAAHAQGIIHRDLKPANIKITPTREAKLLDFGLARAYAAEPFSGGATELAQSPTITANMTRAGVILGTAAYMSPEQARGQAIDKQSDIWSFGVVLHEMLSGERLFDGETVSDSIGAILHRGPDLDELPPLPPQIPRLLRRCLERDKKLRLRDIGDARLELLDAKQRGPSGNAEQPGRSRMAWWIAAAALLLAALFGWRSFGGSSETTLPITTIGLPKQQQINLASNGAWVDFDIAPDGRSVVYVGGSAMPQLYLRAIDSFTARQLETPRFANLPRFSPDGQWIACFGDGQLSKIAVSGGAPLSVCETEGGPGLAWADGMFYFPRSNGGGIWSVSENGGEPRELTQLDDARNETSHRWPSALPDGKHLLITIKTADISTFDDALIGLVDIASGEVRVLLRGGSTAHYADSGHILYGRANKLYAVPFDLESLTVGGTPVPVLDSVETVAVNGATMYMPSSEGALAYLPSVDDDYGFELVWSTPEGELSPLPMESNRIANLALSPDGERLAGMISYANDVVVTYDLRRRTLTRLTEPQGNSDNPVWSPDGRWIAFTNDRNGSNDLHVVASDGSSPARVLLAGELHEAPDCWSLDSRDILLTRAGVFDAEIWIARADGSEEAQPLIQSAHADFAPRLSPDGKWLAYFSNSSGEVNLYIRSYPELGSLTRVSVGGAFDACWSPDGSKLYFMGPMPTGAPGSKTPLYVVDVDGSGPLRVGEPRKLSEFGDSIFGRLTMAPDGSRFLFNRLDPTGGYQYGIRVQFDFLDRLRRL